MARTTKREIGWTDAEENDYRVTLSVTPGTPGRYYGEPGDCYPAEGPEFSVVSVREDRPDGADRPDLIAAVEDELSGPWGDEVAEDFEADAADRLAAAMEDRADARREDARHGL